MNDKSVEILNSLMDVALSYGCDIIEKNQPLHPFLFLLDKNANLNRANELNDTEKLMDINELIESFKITLNDDKYKQSYTGFALGLAVKIERFKNEGFIKAIEIQLEHKTLPQAHWCYLPYKKNDDMSITYGQIFAKQKIKEIL